MTDKDTPQGGQGKKRTLVSQEDFPQYDLESALRIPQIIWDQYAGHPTTPLNVALALKISPTSSTWRYLPGAAVAYGLTNGSYRAEHISLTQLGRRYVAPTETNDDVRAKREAVLKPRVMRQFYERYNGSKFPDDNIAENVLVEFGLPKDRVKDAVRILKSNANQVGILRQGPTGFFIDLRADVSGGRVAVVHQQDNSATVASSINQTQPSALSTTGSEVISERSRSGLNLNPQLQINVEIHIAANATSETVEAIFKNMRKYLMGDGEDA